MCEPPCDITYSAVAKGIKQASEKYAEDYWSRRRGDDVDENEAIETLIEFIKKQRPKRNTRDVSSGNKQVEDKDDTRRILDIVAKHNMSTYYNMLLPQAVCVFFYNSKKTTVSHVILQMSIRCFQNFTPTMATSAWTSRTTS